VQPAAGENPKNDLSFGNEAPATAGHVALAHLAERGDARVVRVLDYDNSVQRAADHRRFT
jgi:hypothetical protein